MATIKLQNNKVLTRDNKVLCECCGCSGCNKNFYELTKATSIDISFVLDGFMPASETFSMIEPYTQVQYSDGERNFYGDSGACGVSFGWNFTENPGSYNSSISLEVFKKNNICMLRISGFTGGAPDVFYTFSTSGFIDVEISQIFGTHNILETGEACYSDLNPNKGCYPISGTKVVTIS